jgi:uroporphyrinogen decarboxylase
MPIQEHLLVRAARGEVVERVPVWAMRQAGRWDPEFQKVRAGKSFYAFSEDVEASAKASLCPRRFGVDGIILFYDITTVPVAMGLPFELLPQVGPMPHQPIRTEEDVARLTAEIGPRHFAHIVALQERVRQELQGELPILLFAGAPFTVASYCIGTGKNIEATRRFALEKPTVWQMLLDQLQNATIRFLNVLIGPETAIYQLFDSWAGELTEAEYRAWAQPYHRGLFKAVTGAPGVIFVKENPYLSLMCESGAAVVSLGKRHDLAQAKADYPQLIFQGNVDDDLMERGSPEEVYAATKACLKAGGGQRHILNLSHGMDKSSPVANFEAYIRAAKDGR